MMRPLRPLRPLLLLTVLLTALPAAAYTLEQFAFEDPARFDEFRALIGELRCLVCQNESLAGSQAEVAQDLREEIYRMMREGQTREQIVEFLVARYGDFVLYEPPLRPSTYLLWFGPFVLVGLGVWVLGRTLIRKRAEPEPELDESERQRLDRLLAAGASPRDVDS